MYRVAVYWPQEAELASRWEFDNADGMLAWLAGVVVGPAYKLVIERVPTVHRPDASECEGSEKAGPALVEYGEWGKL